MPFFIRGKRKRETGGGSKGKKGEKNRLGPKGKNHKKRDDENDEEIDSDLEEDESKLNNDYAYSSESEAEETAQEKRLRLAHKYLDEVEKEEKKRLDTDEVDRDVIAQRLKEDFLEQTGRLRKAVADSYEKHGEFIVLKCKEHSRTITCFVLSSDNKYIYSASDDFNIVKWSLDDRKKLNVINRKDANGHKKKILALAISTDNKFFVSGDKAGKLNVWNPEDLSLIHSFNGHKLEITGLAFRKDTHQLFSCSTDKTVKIWNLDEMMYVETLFGHMSGVTAIDALVKDRAITSGGWDNSLRIWKVPEESHLILNGHKEALDCVKLLNEEFFVSGDEGGNVCLWNSQKKKPLFTLPEAHGADPTSETPNWIISLATYLYSDLFASGSFNGVINLYKVVERQRTFSKLMEINIQGNINCLAFTSDGQYLIAGLGNEHRLGRWHTKKSVQNCLVLIPLIKKSSIIN